MPDQEPLPSTSSDPIKASFPAVSTKLAAPAKKSLFERQRAEAEAKRARDEAETAAIYADFVKSFDDDDGEGDYGRGGGRGRGGLGNVSGSGGRKSGPGSLGPPLGAPAGPGGRRHFVASDAGRKSGPGSLGPVGGMGGGGKGRGGWKREEDDGGRGGFEREYDGGRSSNGRRLRDAERGLFAYDDAAGAVVGAKTAFKMSDDDEEVNKFKDEDEHAARAAARPTVQLTSLPPGTSTAVIKALMPANLTVEGVRILPPSGPGSVAATERKSMSAIVTLAAETPASDIDAAVTALQNRYLGWGFNLSLSRHLSSAALGSMSVAANVPSALSSQPFGAQQKPSGPGPSMSRAPPPMIHRGGFAPPASYDANAYNRGPAFEVQVTPPSDLREIRLIHKTLENVLTHGPSFEALLMTRPEVQMEEKWAWLWNPRSTGGVWYRWRLWQVVSGSSSGGQHNNHYGSAPRSHRLFETGAPWTEPETHLPFEFATALPDLISDSDYDSSDEDDSDDDNPRKRRRMMMHNTGSVPSGKDALAAAADADEQNYLNPLQRAKLTHLLARLPTSTAKLRKGDVARVTAFAIKHASRGAGEVVDMLVDNILRPLSWSKHANPDFVSADSNDDNDDSHAPNGPATVATTQTTPPQDTTPSTLIALYLLSDLLSASSTSGIRHAWRYRALVESALLSRHIFARLGRFGEEFRWGRLRAEKWRRSVQGVLGLWEGWGVFLGGTQEVLVGEFEAAIAAGADGADKEKEKAEGKEKEGERKREGKGGWKAVDGVSGRAGLGGPLMEGGSVGFDVEAVQGGGVDVDGEPMEDVDGEPMDDVDGEPMDEDDDLDGKPMDDDDDADLAAPTPAPPDLPMNMKTELPGTMRAQEQPQPHQKPAEAPPELHNTSNTVKAAGTGGMTESITRRKRPRAEDMFADSGDEE